MTDTGPERRVDRNAEAQRHRAVGASGGRGCQSCLLYTSKELRTGKPSISQEMVDNFILETWTQTAGEKTTIVRAMLRNGFELVEASSCVSPENYDEKLGREICMKKIKDCVWYLLGFLLQTAVNGVK